MSIFSDADAVRIDEKLKPWRQGDVAIGDGLLLPYLADLKMPSSAEARKLADTMRAAGETLGWEVVTSEFLGAVVVSQSCDIGRPFADRPYVKVCPAIEVSEKVFGEIRRHMRPAFALIPELADRRLVADLDRVMTVEKAVIAACERIPGCRSDAEAYAFADALARNVRRPALPDEVGAVVRKLNEHLKDKHNKNTEEGSHLRALAEIRVRARPTWDADTVYMTFYLIKGEEPRGFAPNWEAFLEVWREKLAPTERFKLLGASVVTLAQMSALDYTQSVHLDLDRLSARRE